MIQLELKQRELNKSLHGLRQETIGKLTTDPNFVETLATDREAVREVADAIDSESNETKLLWAFLRICDGEYSFKLVEAIFQELPKMSKGVFLNNVVSVCASHQRLILMTSHANRLAEFALEMKNRMKL